MGSGTRNSTTTRSTKSVTPATPAASTWNERHPLAGPCERAYNTRARPEPDRRNPGASKRPAVPSRSSRRNRKPIVNASAPTGRLT